MHSRSKRTNKNTHHSRGGNKNTRENGREKKNGMFNQTKNIELETERAEKKAYTDTHARTRPFIRDCVDSTNCCRIVEMCYKRTYLLFYSGFNGYFRLIFWIETKNFDACWEHNMRLAHKISWPRMESHRHRIGTIAESCRRKYNISLMQSVDIRPRRRQSETRKLYFAHTLLPLFRYDEFRRLLG